MNTVIKIYYFLILLPMGFVKNKINDPMGLKFAEKKSFYHFESGRSGVNNEE